MWGFFDAPSATAENKILYNRIERFLQELWDGGAVYTTGHQGSSFPTGTLIMGNVALDKRPKAGGNVFYTDGGSRYLILIGNVSFNNPPGTYYFGPHPKMDAPFPYSPLPSLANDTPYGRDIGGCRTYGDILYLYNFWEHDSYFNICPYTDADGTEYPTRLEYVGNRAISSLDEVPVAILLSAGIQEPVP
jgi:hypothetical protein